MCVSTKLPTFDFISRTNTVNMHRVCYFVRFCDFFFFYVERKNRCIDDFINRNERRLWNIKSKEYIDAKAFKLLIEKLKEIDSSATKSTVVNEINNSRGSYRKELKKVKESTRTGSGADDVYRPKLRYFNMLNV